MDGFQSLSIDPMGQPILEHYLLLQQYAIILLYVLLYVCVCVIICFLFFVIICSDYAINCQPAVNASISKSNSSSRKSDVCGFEWEIGKIIIAFKFESGYMILPVVFRISSFA